MSSRLQLVFLMISAVSSEPELQAADGKTPDIRLTLPAEMYAVVGVEMNVYFDNVVLTQTPKKFSFEFGCDVGSVEVRRWRCLPETRHVGRHKLTVTVRDLEGQDIAEKVTMLHVLPANAGDDRKVKILMVGDSLTHATAWPNELARLLGKDANPKWRMLGTHRPSSAATGVAHEGYGGWTWQRFVSKYEPEPDGTHRKRSSPFVFLGENQKPKLDVARYFDEYFDGERPDVVFFLLGINDCFGARPDDPAAIDARIDLMMHQADLLLADFHQAAPEADLAICVTTPPNARESGFEANYKGRYHRWGWKRIQHRLVERLLSKFERKSDATSDVGGHFFVVPTHLNLDPVDGYPENNGVHPNGFGYRQVGASVYSWLKWRLN